MTGEAIAAAARDLVGAPFRLHGRDRATGLDCLGVVALSLRAAGIVADLPRTYGWRNADPGSLIPRCLPPGAGRIVRGPHGTGDVLLLQPGPAQHHLAILQASGAFVHAHAGLRRVVLQPGPVPWPVIAAWRFARSGANEPFSNQG